MFFYYCCTIIRAAYGEKTTDQFDSKSKNRQEIWQTMQAYLFVHFREKTTPDGEQVYFGVSKDGFNWEEVNGGAPVL